jgi:probable phosphoglycerate mutase
MVGHGVPALREDLRILDAKAVGSSPDSTGDSTPPTEGQVTIAHEFYFLRHGQTGWNLEGRTQGQLDAQLDATGRAQAERAAEILATEPIAHIVSSPLSRARHTAEAVAARHGLTVEFDEGLMECHLGEHQGHPHGEWLARYWTGDHDPPGGETFAEFAERVWAAMNRAAASGPRTLIVAHGGLWRAAEEFVEISPRLSPMPNALPIRVIPEAGIWRQQVLDPVSDRSASGSV